MRKPFYRKQTKCWYVKDDAGQFIRLDPDEDKAFKIWEKMRQLADYESPDATIEAICEAFLTSIKLSTKEKRFDMLVSLCKQFCLHVGPDTRARSLRASDVLGWIHSKKIQEDREYEWSVARKRDAGQCIKRVFRWAINHGLFPSCDIMGIRLEQPDPRDTLIPYEVHKKLVMATRERKQSRPFGLVLIALWNSGARPIQIRELTAWHITSDGDWEFRKHKTKGKTAQETDRSPIAMPCNVGHHPGSCSAHW